MEMLLLGTAAAEAWPAPFCVCPSCNEARRRGGMNIRTRSGALIDDELKIDFGPDTVTQLHRTGRNLAKVRTIVFTHQHTDHLVGSELEWIGRPFTNTPPEKVELYANAPAIAEIERALKSHADSLNRLKLTTVAAGDHLTTDAGEEIWFLPAAHVEHATLLRIRRNGKTIFYGHDSGFYPPGTLDMLSDGIPLDIALLDCTSGGQTTDNKGHMDASGVVRMVDELRRRRAITDKTRIIATHFSHNGGLLHEELVRRFLPHGIEVAFDGMIVHVE
jgi:phosphoribosyl 1,2-cyclic phosphate phosphodiesterase